MLWGWAERSRRHWNSNDEMMTSLDGGCNQVSLLRWCIISFILLIGGLIFFHYLSPSSTNKKSSASPDGRVASSLQSVIQNKFSSFADPWCNCTCPYTYPRRIHHACSTRNTSLLKFLESKHTTAADLHHWYKLLIAAENEPINKLLRDSPHLPRYIIQALSATHQACQRFPHHKLFRKYKIDSESNHFVDNNDEHLTLDISPFISAGGFQALADYSYGRETEKRASQFGIFCPWLPRESIKPSTTSMRIVNSRGIPISEYMPITTMSHQNPRRSGNHLVIQFKGEHPWGYYQRLEESLHCLSNRSVRHTNSKDPSLGGQALIINHSDSGFPTNDFAKADIKSAHQYAEKKLKDWGSLLSPIIDENYIASNNTNHLRHVPWTLFISNFDDFTGTLSQQYPQRIYPIPLGLTTSVLIESQLKSLCALVKREYANPVYPQKWILVAMKAENNVNERTQALEQMEALQNRSMIHRGEEIEAKEGSHQKSILDYDIPVDRRVTILPTGSTYDETITAMMNHKFVLSPSGRGYDTHRILESLMLGRIPIVRWIPAICAYEHLPVLRVNEWSDLTWDLLKVTWVRHMTNANGDTLSYDMRKLFMPYWKELLEQCLKRDIEHSKPL